MKEIFNIIEQITEAKGKAKQEIVAEHFKNATFQRVLVASLSQLGSYGIGSKTMAQIEKESSEHPLENTIPFDEKVWDVLTQLATRQLTGNAAKSVLVNFKTNMHLKDWTVLKRIILKDLRAGITANTVNRVSPDFIEIFSVMLAHKYDPKNVASWPVNVEIKHDGVRVTALVDSDKRTVNFYSRDGNEFFVFDHVKADLLSMVDVMRQKTSFAGILVFDGEMISGDFADTVSDIHKKNHNATDAIYHVFEILSYKEFKCKTISSGQGDRRNRLERFFELIGRVCKLSTVALMHSEKAHSDEEVNALFAKYFSAGYEGIIVKLLEEPYVNKRSNGYMKIKGEESEDLKIVGFERGEVGKKYENTLGAIVVDFNGVRVSVSSGLSDELRDHIWNNQEEYLGRIVEIIFHEVTPDLSLRHPRFKRFRDSLKKGSKE
ncbi:hypothetical protein [Shewanella glacialipiscicola]|uniref:ATP-dependent DNA ligase n=1 Tax=Shewanella glacialipiscicola TaxID=614069 RepID=UPI003D798D87